MSGRTVLTCIAVPIVLFLAIQLVPVWLLQTNPPVVAEPNWPNPQTRELAVRACYDCHSNETQWYWYARIAPASWYVTLDVVRGRRALNFSDWNNRSGEGREGGERGGGGAARQVERGGMPPSQYVVIHPTANLTDAEKQQLIQGLQALQ